MITAENVYMHVYQYRPGGMPEWAAIGDLSLKQPPSVRDGAAAIQQLINALVVSGFLERHDYGSRGVWLQQGKRQMLPSLMREIDATGTITEPTKTTRKVPCPEGALQVLTWDNNGCVELSARGAPSDLGPYSPVGEDDVAVFEVEDLPRLGRALRKALQAAEHGEPFCRKVEGSDVGDVEVQAGPDAGNPTVRLTVVPYSRIPEEEEEEEEETVPDAVEDDNGVMQPLTAAERAAWAEAIQQDRERAQATAPPPPRLDPMTALLSAEQADELATSWGARPQPAGRPRF